MTERDEADPRAGGSRGLLGPPYVPLDARGWRLAMGLRPLEWSRWLEFGPDAEDQLAERARLLDAHRDAVVAIREGTEAACVELAEEVVANLAAHHRQRPHTLDVAEHPLVAAAHLVTEDLCVMVRAPDAWRLGAAVVCFPSRWSLADKIGASLDQIHAPVPGYEETLASPTSSFFDRLGPARGFWRLNWTLLDDPALFQPGPARHSPQIDPAHWTFRVERQTLRRLARSGAVVFSIRTYLTSAADLVAGHENVAEDIARFLETAPSATRAYKGWVDLAPRWRARFVA